jgi:hypothetical protein
MATIRYSYDSTTYFSTVSKFQRDPQRQRALVVIINTTQFPTALAFWEEMVLFFLEFNIVLSRQILLKTVKF